MRRDICYYYPAPVVQVYQAYLTAAGNEPFRRECREEPYHTLTFGLNFSAKYNFNGGSCVIRFMPWQGGTAVNLRFSLAQLAGARYEWYDRDLTAAASAIVGVVPQPTSIPVEHFLIPGNQTVAAPAAPAPAPAPEPVAQVAPTGNFCTECGKAVPDGALFCCYCGKALPPKELTCQTCGKVNPDGAKFCAFCGNKF